VSCPKREDDKVTQKINALTVAPVRVARTTCCPGARSARELTRKLNNFEQYSASPPVAFGHPDNK